MLRGTFKAILAVGAAMLAMQSINAAAVSRQVYTVKFVCGTQQPITTLNAPSEPPVKPGNYATVVNIEALSEGAAVEGQVSVAGGGKPAVITPPLALSQQFQTVDFTCADIAKAAGSSASSFITGYLNIAFKGPIKVTAVYTAQGCAFSPLIRPICSGATNVDVVPQDPQPLGPPNISQD